MPTAADFFYNQFANSTPLTAQALTLSDMRGFVQVRSLREAANDGEWRMAA